jgi:hypothetical protein
MAVGEQILLACPLLSASAPTICRNVVTSCSQIGDGDLSPDRVVVPLQRLSNAANAPIVRQRRPAPRVRDWLSVGSVVLVAGGLVAMRVVAGARRRVIVERFGDYTGWNSGAGNGVATQLVGELGRIGDLFRQAHSDVLIPRSVKSDGECGNEPARFLTADTDGLTRVLEEMAASEAQVVVGGLIKIPVGPVLSAFNQLIGRPRVLGALHSSEDGRSLTLTAQLIGGRATGTWRVERQLARDAAGDKQTELGTMVRELAYRMFTELSFDASVRVEAVKAFAKYLQLYHQFSAKSVVPIGLLRQAARELQRAVKEDEAFGVAYYNLGMIYTKLAHAKASHEATPNVTRTESARDTAPAQWRKQAQDAFLKATQRTPEYWQAHYALAAREFIRTLTAAEVDEGLCEYDDGSRGQRRDRRADRLENVIRRCDRALAAGPPARSSTAVVHDLRGTAMVHLAATLRRRRAAGATSAPQCAITVRPSLRVGRSCAEPRGSNAPRSPRTTVE